MDVQQIIASTQEALTVRRVFGDPIQVDGVTLIPTASVRGGAGGGGKTGEQGGVGFGLKARPTGTFVVKNGDVSWKPAVDVNRIILGGQLVAITALLTVVGPAVLSWMARRSR